MERFDINKVSGIGDYSEEKVMLGDGVDAEQVVVFRNGERVFLVLRKNTLEVRTDERLRDLLRQKYESVMESRYFGRGGIEIVDSGQLDFDEVCDLVRLSYRLSGE